MSKLIKGAKVVPATAGIKEKGESKMKVLDSVIEVLPEVREVTKRDNSKTTVVPVVIAGKEQYAWASKAVLVRGVWKVPNYKLKMQMEGAVDSDFQEYTARDGHKYVAVKVFGDVPKGIQIVGWRSHYDDGVVLLEVTIWPDYFQK